MKHYTQIIPQDIQLLLGWNNPATYADVFDALYYEYGIYIGISMLDDDIFIPYISIDKADRKKLKNSVRFPSLSAIDADENGWFKVANIAIKAALEMLNPESELFLCKKDPNVKKKKK